MSETTPAGPPETTAETPDMWMKADDEPPGMFDKPANVTVIYYALIVICVLLAAADFFYHKHVHYEIENLIGAFGIYGFVSCVALVLAAKELRKLLMRQEDYYDHDSQ